MESTMQASQLSSNVEDTKKKLREIFSYYASFGDRMNVTNLKSNKFHKIMQDSGIILKQDQMKNNPKMIALKKQVDLIFCSVNKSKPNMSFDNFLTSLIRISMYIYMDHQVSP